MGGDRTNWACRIYGGGTWCSAAGGYNGAGGGSGYFGGVVVDLTPIVRLVAVDLVTSVVILITL